MQAGAYGEHRFRSATIGERTVNIEGPDFQVHLQPGAGQQMVLEMDFFARQPSLSFPWE